MEIVVLEIVHLKDYWDEFLALVSSAFSERNVRTLWYQPYSYVPVVGKTVQSLCTSMLLFHSLFAFLKTGILWPYL